ncbi:MAG: class I SAM-dependent methyltransferase [Cyanobacteria bacterium]|nr:class I SAM-dependent methyltransferase [Cyanobacteriota bacterium]
MPRFGFIFFIVFGPWVARRFGVDARSIAARAETLFEEVLAITRLTPRQVAGLLMHHVSLQWTQRSPLPFEQACAVGYSHLSYVVMAHVDFAVHPAAMARERFVQTIADQCGKSARIADVGCGPGFVLINVTGRRAGWTGFGVDISSAAIEYATARARLQDVATRCSFSCGDVQNLPLTDSTFDLVIASEVLEHVPHLERALSEIRRVLRPGGKALLTVPLRSRTAFHLHELDLRDFTRRVGEAGLHIRTVEVHRYPSYGNEFVHAFLCCDAGHPRADAPPTTASQKNPRPYPAAALLAVVFVLTVFEPSRIVPGSALDIALHATGLLLVLITGTLAAFGMRWRNVRRVPPLECLLLLTAAALFLGSPLIAAVLALAAAIKAALLGRLGLGGVLGPWIGRLNLDQARLHLAEAPLPWGGPLRWAGILVVAELLAYIRVPVVCIVRGICG